MSKDDQICVYVSDTDDFGVITVRPGKLGFCCLTCGHQTASCCHIDILNSWEHSEELPDHIKDMFTLSKFPNPHFKRPTYCLRPDSTKLIPVDVPEHHKKIFNGDIAEHLLHAPDGTVILIPTFKCWQCSQFNTQEAFTPTKVQLIGLSQMLDAAGITYYLCSAKSNNKNKCL